MSVYYISIFACLTIVGFLIARRAKKMSTNNNEFLKAAGQKDISTNEKGFRVVGYVLVVAGIVGVIVNIVYGLMG